MKKFDVIIIGAGPAGLGAAISCSEKGLNTLIIEKSSEIGYPMKTSALTWIEVVEEWSLSEESIATWITSVLFQNHHTGEKFEIDFEEKVGCVLDYHSFLLELTKKYILCGGQINLREEVKSPILDNKRVVGVRTNVSEYYAKLIIDASGPASAIGSKIGIVKFSEAPLGVGAELELFGLKLEKMNRIEFHVGKKEVVPIGYGWVFPTGKNQARIGLATVFNTKEKVDEKDITKHLQNFIDKNTSVIRSTLHKAQPLEYHYGAYPLNGILEKPYANGIFLVGDAASHASPMLGEGIRYGLKFGKFAGIAAAKFIKNELTEEEAQILYVTKCKEYLLDHYDVALKLLEVPTDEYWDKIVRNLKGNRDLVLKYLQTRINSQDYIKLIA